jgi:hypothetical protein
LATVDLVDARGPLGGTAGADFPGPIEYHLISGQPIQPNIQMKLGVN